MGTLGPNTGGTFASDATLGVVAITNPASAQLSDNAYATAVLLATQTTQYLKATNFGFSIPLDATITGRTVNVERSSTVGSTTNDNSIKLVKGGTISGNEKATGTAWGTSDSVATYGSSSDLWGLTLTPADVNLSTFGVVVSAITTLAATAQIDMVSITIDYTGSNRPMLGSVIKSGDGMSVNGGYNR